MGWEKQGMGSTNLLIVSLLLDLSSTTNGALENDPLELARQMSEKGITLVCYRVVTLSQDGS
jgi:hypothetical protein